MLFIFMDRQWMRVLVCGYEVFRELLHIYFILYFTKVEQKVRKKIRWPSWWYHKGDLSAFFFCKLWWSRSIFWNRDRNFKAEALNFFYRYRNFKTKAFIICNRVRNFLTVSFKFLLETGIFESRLKNIEIKIGISK